MARMLLLAICCSTGCLGVRATPGFEFRILQPPAVHTPRVLDFPGGVVESADEVDFRTRRDRLRGSFPATLGFQAGPALGVPLAAPAPPCAPPADPVMLEVLGRLRSIEARLAREEKIPCPK